MYMILEDIVSFYDAANVIQEQVNVFFKKLPKLLETGLKFEWILQQKIQKSELFR